MIQQSQGPIADRTREVLTATDAAVVKFRRTVMGAAQALMEGQEPDTPWRHQAYTTRPGSWIVTEGTPFEDVLLERFGDERGRVPAE